MITLDKDELVFAFPEVHPKARLRISFQRTLRIPDDGRTYPLPPGMGRFPIRHVDDHAGEVPAAWLDRGGVMMPMYQSEALWLYFDSADLQGYDVSYPFAVKIATGKINAVTGKPWTEGLGRRSQDYVVVPEQPWLDGYCVKKGVIRQFVAMPLGAGFSVEEQLTGAAEYGGMQVAAYPMKRAAFEKRFKPCPRPTIMDRVCYSSAMPDMGLAPGGRMKQEIYEDEFEFDEWEQDVTSRCFIHIANSMVWRAITGATPPTVPFTAKEYTNAGLPWYDYYNDKLRAIRGSQELGGVKSVKEFSEEHGKSGLPENETVNPKQVVTLVKDAPPNRVREWV